MKINIWEWFKKKPPIEVKDELEIEEVKDTIELSQYAGFKINDEVERAEADRRTTPFHGGFKTDFIKEFVMGRGKNPRMSAKLKNSGTILGFHKIQKVTTILSLLMLIGSLFLVGLSDNTSKASILPLQNESLYPINYNIQPKDYIIDPVNIQKDEFTIQRNLLVVAYKNKNRVAMVSQIPEEDLLKMNKQIVTMFKELVLNKVEMATHVKDFFYNTKDLDKLETALMEQAKYGIPASVKLGQASWETGWGLLAIGNNYFGVKGPSAVETKTTEYFTKKELKNCKRTIISQKKIGENIYECLIVDHFSEYETPWHSFRGHSKLLAGNPRYAMLFTGGNMNYKHWLKGLSKYGYFTGGRPYVKGVSSNIRKYQLYLLDYK